MNINPGAIKILCYGDSNTWGYNPRTKKRYPVGVRWTSVLQKKLGKGYWVIEEGLNGRTTNLDDPGKIWRNGFTYLHPCLETHNPIDLVILMLGTNDMKDKFMREPEDIAHSVGLLLDETISTALNSKDKTSKVLVAGPPLVDESIDGVSEIFKDAGVKSKRLGKLFKEVALDHRAEYINIAQYVPPSSVDGFHFDPESHQIIAVALFTKIKDMF